MAQNLGECPVCGNWAELNTCLDFFDGHGDYLIGVCGSCPTEKKNIFINRIKNKEELDMTPVRIGDWIYCMEDRKHYEVVEFLDYQTEKANFVGANVENRLLTRKFIFSDKNRVWELKD